jgi:hypothetical protein
VRSGEAYVDVGTLHGYRAAMTLLAETHYARRTAAAVVADLPARRGGSRFATRDQNAIAEARFR